ncbi:MAG: hypothetical protein IJ560_02440 [Alphaproteobacteria bacterium]|nr:hypothetical protein [Alphaproteobacteria bacterium]
MKHEYITSAITIACTICATTAHGVSAVRSLGGVGTYVSANAAANSVSGANAAVTTSDASAMNTGAVATRGGAVRINPATTRTTTAAAKTSGTRTTGRVATSPRLSIGKYLGVSGVNAGAGPSALRANINAAPNVAGNVGAETASELRSDVDNLQRSAEEFAEQLDNKQDKLTSDANAGDYIDISDDGEISVNVNELKNAFIANAGDGDPIEIGTDDDNNLLWRYVGDDDDNWRVLATLSDIVGSTDMNAAIVAAVDAARDEIMADVYTKTQTDELIGEIDKIIGDTDDLETTTHDSVVAAINELKSTSATSGALDELTGQVDDLLDYVGDETLETTADTIVGAINEVRSYTLPLANPICTAPSNLCVLSINGDGELEWVAVTEPAYDTTPVPVSGDVSGSGDVPYYE